MHIIQKKQIAIINDFTLQRRSTLHILALGKAPLFFSRQFKMFGILNRTFWESNTRPRDHESVLDLSQNLSIGFNFKEF